MRLVAVMLICITFLRAHAQDVHENVTVDPSTGLEAARHLLENLLIGDDTIPQLIMNTDGEEVKTRVIYYPSIKIKSVESGIVTLKHGFTSKIYHFTPDRSNGLNIPIIYHAGHVYGVAVEDNYINDTHADSFPVRVIDYFLSKGFDVIGIDMPEVGDNYAPSEVTENGITYPMFAHNDLFYLDHPFYYFIAPVKSAVNYFQQHYGYDHFIMMGLSGGGWTTTVYSAMDSRITQSFPVAGSVPVPLRITSSDWGDAEQHDPSLYNQFNYTTLYVLGAAGSNRLQYQVLNKHDDCCFAFDADQYWVPDVRKALQKSNEGGSFGFFYDTFSLTHHISSVAVDSIHYHIIYDLANNILHDQNKIDVHRRMNVICDNDTLDISIANIGDNIINWYRNGVKITDSAGPVFHVTSEGTYYARLINLSGADTYTDSIFIRQRHKFDKPVVTERNGRLFSSYSSDNQWYFNDNPIPGAIGQSVLVTNEGKYTVRVSVRRCTSDFSDPYDYGLNILPNPASDHISVRLSTDLLLVYYSLTSLDGKMITAGGFTGEVTILLNNIKATGMYILRLDNHKGFTATKKIWVAK